MSTRQDFYLPSGIHKPGLKTTWPAYGVLVFMLVLTFLGWKLSESEIKAKLETKFEAENSRVMNRMTSTLSKQVEVLRSLQELYRSNVQVVRDVFELFAMVPTGMYSSIQSICFAPRIDIAHRSEFKLYAMNEGYRNYEIKSGFTRKEVFPVEYIVPLEPNINASGVDLYSVKFVNAALDTLRRTRSITLTPPVDLISTGEPGFIIMAPVTVNDYVPTFAPDNGDSLLGVCFAEIKVREFFREVTEGLRADLPVSFAVYDGTEQGNRFPLFGTAANKNALLQAEREIRLGGRKWTIAFSTRSGFGRDLNTNLPLFVILAGILTSLLGFAFVRAQVTSRFHAQEIAERITRSQRRILEASQDMIGAVTFEGIWRSMNPASRLILGYSPEALIGTSHFDLVHPVDKERIRTLLTSMRDGNPVSFEARYMDVSGDVRWIQWNLSPSIEDELVFLVGRDVTEKKNAEDAIRRKNLQLDLAGMIADRENLQKARSVREQSQHFRTELTNIIGFLDIVLTEKSLSPEEKHDFIRTAHDSADKVLDFLRQTTELSITRMTDITFSEEELLLSRLMQDVKVELLRRRLHEKVEIADFSEHEFPPLTGVDSGKLKDSIVFLVKALSRDISGPIHIEGFHDPDTLTVGIVMTLEGSDSMTERNRGILTEESRPDISGDDNAFNLAVARRYVEVMRGRFAIESDQSSIRVRILFPLT